VQEKKDKAVGRTVLDLADYYNETKSAKKLELGMKKGTAPFLKLSIQAKWLSLAGKKLVNPTKGSGRDKVKMGGQEYDLITDTELSDGSGSEDGMLEESDALEESSNDTEKKGRRSSLLLTPDKVADALEESGTSSKRKSLKREESLSQSSSKRELKREESLSESSSKAEKKESRRELKRELSKRDKSAEDSSVSASTSTANSSALEEEVQKLKKGSYLTD
jgi:hypothetical protein